MIEFFFHLHTVCIGRLLASPLQPIGFNRMDHTDPDNRRSSYKSRIEPCKIVLDHSVFPIPWGLVSDTGRIISFCLSLHADPGQVMDPYRHSQGCLPVSCQFMSPEIKIPVCHTVKLTCHSFSAKLMHCALGLFRCCQLSPVTQHINSGNVKAPVRPHGFSQGGCLTLKSRFFHHVSGQRKVMCLAPGANLVCISTGEPLCDMVMILISCF